MASHRWPSGGPQRCHPIQSHRSRSHHSPAGGISQASGHGPRMQYLNPEIFRLATSFFLIRLTGNRVTTVFEKKKIKGADEEEGVGMARGRDGA